MSEEGSEHRLAPHLDADDVLVPQVPEKLDLTERPGRIRDVFERIGDLLDRYLLPSFCISRRANYPVSPLSCANIELEGARVGVRWTGRDVRGEGGGNPPMECDFLVVQVGPLC